MPSHCPLTLNRCSEMHFFSGQWANSVGKFPLRIEAKSLIFCRFLPVSVGNQWAVSGQWEGNFAIMIPTHLSKQTPAQCCPSLRVFGEWLLCSCRLTGACRQPTGSPDACVAAEGSHRHHRS